MAPSHELAQAIKALAKLIFLRDYYNEDWEPDWRDDNSKYCIEIYQGRIISECYRGTSRVLAFKTQEIRNEFLREQKELIEIAKPLL